jgi:Fur family iron response transcriptional regulator
MSENQTRDSAMQGEDLVAFYASVLSEHDIYPTVQRLKIAAVLLAKRQHCSADEVFSRVNETSPVASKATVYNTLRLFARKGLVNEVVVDPAKVFFDSNTDPHYHFYDIDTGALTDVSDTQIQLKTLPCPAGDAVIVGVDVVIRVRSRVR